MGFLASQAFFWFFAENFHFLFPSKHLATLARTHTRYYNDPRTREAPFYQWFFFLDFPGIPVVQCV